MPRFFYYCFTKSFVLINIKMLIVNNLSFKRNNKKIFENINISLTPNNMIHIKGTNGIGKTTLIKILSNILLPTNGYIFWNNKNINKDLNNYYKDMTLITDTNTSKKDMTIIENINFWKTIFLSNKKDDEIDSILDLLGIYKYKNIMTKYISLGEARKLELCRLIIENKKLWLLDEPYLGLDQNTIGTINETFKSHTKKEGMIIFTSHFNPQIPNINELDLNKNVYI